MLAGFFRERRHRQQRRYSERSGRGPSPVAAPRIHFFAVISSANLHNDPEIPTFAPAFCKHSASSLTLADTISVRCSSPNSLTSTLYEGSRRSSLASERSVGKSSFPTTISAVYCLTFNIGNLVSRRCPEPPPPAIIAGFT